MGGSLGPALACGAASALLLMLSAVNVATAAGAGSLLKLLARYVSQLVAEVFVGRKLLVALALVFGGAATFFGVKSVMSEECA